MTSPNGPQRMSSILFAALGAVVFVSLIILGDALVSVTTNTDVIETPGSGPLVPVIAIGAATACFALITKRGLDRRAGIAIAVVAAVFSGAAYIAGLFLGSLGSGIAAVAVVTHVLAHGYVLVVVAAALLVATGVLTLIRVEGKRLQWPWEKGAERNEDDDT